jgi:mRNA-degrading endonuclease toxin of MazEF toxin-antitoxin module
LAYPRHSCVETLAKGESILTSPLPGQIYWGIGDEDMCRPFVVVSREELNRGIYVVAIPLTTERLSERYHLPNCVFFQRGSFGLEKDCVAQAEAITSLDKSDLDIDGGPIGTVDSTSLRSMIRAIGNVISANCEPT